MLVVANVDADGLSVLDESGGFSSNPDVLWWSNFPALAAQGLAMDHANALDKTHPFSSQARRGLDCARRGKEGRACDVQRSPVHMGDGGAGGVGVCKPGAHAAMGG